MARIKHLEIAGVDGETLQIFFGKLFGWEVTRRDMNGNDYYDMNVPGDLTAGIRHEPNGEAEVVVYVEVDDLNRSLTSALALGARVRIPPGKHGVLQSALIQDPEGNPIGLIQSSPRK